MNRYQMLASLPCSILLYALLIAINADSSLAQEASPTPADAAAATASEEVKPSADKPAKAEEPPAAPPATEPAEAAPPAESPAKKPAAPETPAAETADDSTTEKSAAPVPKSETPAPAADGSPAPAADESPAPAADESAAPAAATEPTDEEIPDEPQGPLQLGTPTIAEALKLSKDQRDQIAELIAQREAALAEVESAEAPAAPDGTTDPVQAAKEAITSASDAKLLSVLTEVQRGDFLGQPVDKRLQFTFRYQPWVDVLEWFAEQAELSLVLDVPPPGTFNYTDSREYTPQEAIDLLNGVLISKGFALVRRGRMLMVIDLSEGIPEGIVPRVELEDLDEHGKFEFVTVQFALGRRDGDAIQAAIEPLLSPYHKLLLVKATSQLYVTDQAGIMRRVNDVIQATPERPIPPTPPEPTPPPPIEQKVYAIDSSDPESVVALLKELFATATIVLDSNLNQLHIGATASMHASIQAVLDEMASETAEDRQRRLEVYPIGELIKADGADTTNITKRATSRGTTSSTQLLETLKAMVPNAQLSIDDAAKTLIAWGTPAEHEILQEALDKLGQTADHSPQTTRQLEVHRLTKVDPDTTLSLFQTIVPDARLAVDAQTRSLIAVALPEEQELIRNTLKTLQPTEPGPDTPELQFYELTLAMPPDFPDVIQKVAPNAIVALDQSGMRLMVIASPAEHAKVGRTIQNLQKTTFIQGRPKLVFYPVTAFQRRRFESVWASLSKELPGVELVTDGQPGELAIWARPYQHEVIVEIMEELKREVPETEKFQLSTYPIKSEDPSGIVSMLETLYPETRIILDAAGERLLVWTSQQEHASIKKSLEELNATASETTSSVEIYRLTHADPTSTLTLIQSLVPDAKLSLDTRSENLIAYATAEDHQTVVATLEKLQPSEPDPNAPELQFYPFEQAPSVELIEVLQELAPTAKITVDVDGERLIVLASATSQATIKANFEQITEANAAKGKPELKVYPLQPTADLVSLQAMLVKLYPDTEIVADAKSNRLLVWASDETQTSLSNSLDQLGAGASPDDQPRFESYPIHGFSTATSATTLTTTLQTLVPNARITVDDRIDNLIVWATAQEHTILAQALDRLGQGSAPQHTPQLEVYRLTKADPTSTLALLQKLVPDAQLTLDAKTGSLIALAVPTDHSTIVATLEQLQPAAAGPNAPMFQFHPLLNEPDEALLKVLTELAPDAQVTADAENKRLTVVATEATQQIVRQVIEQFESSTPLDEPNRLVVYPVTSTQKRRFEALLPSLTKDMPSIQVVGESEPGELAIWAKPTAHLKIGEMLKQMEQDVPETEQLRLVVYPFAVVDAAGVSQFLEELFPNVKFIVDERTRRVMVWARGDEHEKIGPALEQISTGATADYQEEFKAYPAENIDSTTAIEMLQELLPNVKLATDTKAGKILAWGSKTDQAVIAKTIEEMQAGSGGGTSVAVYVLDGATATSSIYAIRLLTSAFPNGRFSAGADPSQIVAWAESKDHAEIKALFDELNAGPGIDAANKLSVYTLQHVSADGVSDVLETVAPKATINVDTENPRRLTVWASPEDQQRIESVLTELDTEDAAGASSTVGVYNVGGSTYRTAYYAMRFLAQTLPEAEFTLGTEDGQIVAWATAEDHEQIKTLVEQITEGADPENMPTAAIYTLKSITADAALSFLNRALPEAELTTDTENPARLTAWASPAEQEQIASILNTIDAPGEPGSDSSVAVYKLDGVQSSSAMVYTYRMLAEAFPKARFSAGAELGQVVAWTTAQEHADIKALFVELNAGPPPEEQPMVAVYSLQFITAANAASVLKGAVPKATFTPDADNPQRLTALAIPADHETVKTVLAELDTEDATGSSSTAVIYNVQGGNSRSAYYAMRFLTEIVPDARFTLGTEDGQVVAWATAKDHEQIASLVKQITEEPAPEEAPTAAVYMLKNIPATAAAAFLENAVPEAEFTEDATDPSRLTTWASPAEHVAIKTILQEIDIEGEAGGGASVAVYKLDGVKSSSSITYALQLLVRAFPGATFSAGAELGQIVAWASARDHTEIKALFDELNAGPPPEEEPKVTVYSLEFITAAAASSVLQTAVPNATLTVDAENPQRLTAWATPVDQATITTIVNEIDTQDAEGISSIARIYTLEGMDSRRVYYALRFLTATVPDAKIAQGVDESQLVAWATEKDHEQIQSLIDQITKEPDPAKAPTARIYTLEGMDARAAVYAIRFLTATVPTAEFTPGTEEGQLIAWASEKDHVQIQSLIDQLTTEPDPEKAPTAVVYTLKNITAASAQTFLTTAVPNAQFTVDAAEPGRLATWASPADHAKITAILTEIDVEGDDASGSSVAVYKLDDVQTTATITYALRLLTGAFPKAQFSAGAELGQVVAWATEQDHQDIKALFDELNAGPPPEEAPTVTVYTLQFITATAASTVLTTAVPDAKITTDVDLPQRLTAWASPDDHASIKTILQQIDVEDEEGSGATVAVYQLENVATAASMSYTYRLVTEAFPKARFSLGTEIGQVIAWASPKDHTEIAALFEKLNAEPLPEEAPTAAVYSLKFITAADASAILKKAVPKAELTPDATDTARLTAWASPEDQQTIQALLEVIDIEGEAGSGSAVEIYKLDDATSTTTVSYALRLMVTAFPNARFSAGAELGQIVVWATAKDHAEIQALFDKLNAAPSPEETPKVTVYTLQFMTAANASAVLRNAVPEAIISLDTDEPQRMTAWAIPEDHLTIATILKEIDVESDPDSGAKAVVYQLKGMSITQTAYAVRFLASAFPSAKFTAGAQAGSVVAWATADDHADIQELVDQLEQEAPEIVVYDLKFISAANAQAVLTAAVPEAKLTPDPTNPQRFTAWAITDDHASITSILAKIDVETDPNAGAQVVIYSLAEMDPGVITYAYRLLGQAVPSARFTPGAEPGSVVVWATAQDHAKIAPLIEQLTQTPPPERTPTAVVYGLKFITAASASQVLVTAVPQAKITTALDDPQRLTAWARPSEHETIAKIIAEIDVEGDPDTLSKAVVYQMKGVDARSMIYALRFLASAFPNAQFTQGAQAGSVVAWANVGDHKDIQELVDQLAQEAATIAVYDLKSLPASTASQVLASAVPEAELTADPENPRRFTAWAIPADHETIKAILTQIDVKGDPATMPSAVVYELEGMDARGAVYALRFLEATFPEARFVQGADPSSVVVWATAEDHLEIEPLMKQLAQEPAEIAVYALKSLSAAGAQAVLTTAVPEAELTIDAEDPQRLTAWATASDHATIKTILTQIDVEPSPETAQTAVVYTLEGMTQIGSVYAVRLLMDAYPDATFTLGADPTQLVAFATPKDHLEIKELVRQLIEESPDAARTAQVYSLKQATATAAMTLLRTAVPDAGLSAGSDPGQLVVWGRPADHEKVAQIIEQIDAKGSPDTEPKAVLYTLQASSATEAMRILATAVPQARLSVGAEPHQLLAWARPADHEIIQQVVDKIAEQGPDELAAKAVVYTIPTGDAAQAQQFLQTAVPEARFSVASDPRRLIVWARPADHAVIARAVQEMTTDAAQISTHVYRFRYADPQAAYEVLQTLVPSATLAVDENEQTLVASAMPEDHLKIQATIDQMDSDDAEGQRPSLKIHRVEVGDASMVYRSLYILFRNDDAIQLSLDTQNDAIVAIASPTKHERIEEMIRAVAEVAKQDAEATIVLYSLKNTDSTSAMEILDDVMGKQGVKADLSYDYSTNQLIAIAKPDVHKVVAETLEQLRGEEPVLEIYELQYVDPMSAEIAIAGQFADEGTAAPELDLDPITEQLFIRATVEQQEQIRDLLIKMGETRLALLKGRGSDAMRTIRFQGDVNAAVQEIQRVWSKLRANEIRVVSPSTPLPAPPTSPPATLDESPQKTPAVQDVPPRQAPDDEAAPPAAEVAPKPNESTRAATGPFQLVGFQPPVDASDQPQNASSPSSATDAPAVADGGNAETATNAATLPPVYVMPGEGTVTIVCDDPEALEQFEKLLRTLSGGDGTTGEIGRNISVFPIEHSDALEVAAKLQGLFSSTQSTWRRGIGAVSIVADERLNTIMVQGSRIDRETIESLIRVLDSGRAEGDKPQIIPLRNIDAEEVADIVQDVFRSHMTATGSSSVSSRGRTSTSSMGRRMLPSVSVDHATNSLIVMAAAPLMEEIQDLVTTLDQSAGENPARRLKIIPLTKVSSSRVQEALDKILDSSSTRRSR